MLLASVPSLVVCAGGAIENCSPPRRSSRGRRVARKENGVGEFMLAGLGASFDSWVHMCARVDTGLLYWDSDVYNMYISHPTYPGRLASEDSANRSLL